MSMTPRNEADRRRADAVRHGSENEDDIAWAWARMYVSERELNPRQRYILRCNMERISTVEGVGGWMRKYCMGRDGSREH